MKSFRFADITLDSSIRGLSFPTLFCKGECPVVPESVIDTNADADIWILSGAGTFDFTTYFNSLSVKKLKKYTISQRFSLHLELKGAACTFVQTMGDALAAKPIEVQETEREIGAAADWQVIDIPLKTSEEMIIVGFKLKTQGQVRIRNCYYSVEYDGNLRDVELTIATTTFKKEKFVEHNLELIQREILDSDEEIAEHLHVAVVDNGRTLNVQELSADKISVIPNDNVGGSGGFARGMIAAMEQTPVATHVILMDDDVAISAQSIKRTYNLLRLVNTEYQDAFISGAMLDYDIPYEQLEDTGYMRSDGMAFHEKNTFNLTRFEDIVSNEQFTSLPEADETRYAGWWYCCIPMTQIQKYGLPLPIFVRGDDAEYGVRCRPKFITMGGICIWHMAFYAKSNSAVERYQISRNSLIAQATSDFAPHSDFLHKMFADIRLDTRKYCYDNAELVLDGFEDFLKGPEFIKQRGAVEAAFMKANKAQEKLVGFEELMEQASRIPDLKDFDVYALTREDIYGDKPRSLQQRLTDLITENQQRYLANDGSGYAVISSQSWVYPAGVIRGKKYLIAIDWHGRKGVIRKKDVARYKAIQNRYKRDVKYYKQNIERLRAEYSAAKQELTSLSFWKDYLGMN